MTPDSVDDLQANPLWCAGDLGKPLPGSLHAVSVSMPAWAHVVGYEECEEAVISALKCGYPRFFRHPLIQQLFAEASRRFSGAGEISFVFPSQAAAEHCVEYLKVQDGCVARVDPYGANDLFCVTLPEGFLETAGKFWQHFGDVVSSRCAEATLAGEVESEKGGEAKLVLRERIGGFAGVAAENVFLYPSGMAAASGALALAQARCPDAKSIQLGFPYVDVLRIQKVAGPGVHFFPKGEACDLDAIEAILAEEAISCVVTEFPGNALLRSVDILKLSALLKRHDVPLIVDDTVSTCINTRLFPHADLVVSSLTKSFSGAGDVMAGSVVFNSQSPYFEAFKESHRGQFTGCLWGDDAVVLEENSRDAEQRIARMSDNAEKLCAFLVDHPKVAQLHYPKYSTPANYHAMQRDGGGFCSLFSIVLKDAAETASRFYDALRVCKGPSLGNNFTLACPYTLLAHYTELDWVASVGISPYLVRVSVGLESPDDLIERFARALEAV